MNQTRADSLMPIVYKVRHGDCIEELNSNNSENFPMAVKLRKNQAQALAAGITEAMNTIGWDVRKTTGKQFDLDITAFLCDANEKALGDEWLVMYDPDDQTRQTQSPDGAVTYSGDNRTGEGDGPDEWMKIDFTKLDPRVQIISICASIDGWEESGDTFGALQKAGVKVEQATGAEAGESYEVDLVDTMSVETAMIFVKYYRTQDGWKIKNVSQGFETGLAGLVEYFGLEVDG